MHKFPSGKWKVGGSFRLLSSQFVKLSLRLLRGTKHSISITQKRKLRVEQNETGLNS